jgi:hypothetical protein
MGYRRVKELKYDNASKRIPIERKGGGVLA